MKLAFTGHRPESLPFGNDESDPCCERLKELLYDEIISKAKDNYTTFYSGAARGADIFFAEQVLRAKQNGYPNIQLVCVIPHEEQAASWSEAWRERYFALLEQADDTVLISAHYTRDCFHRRNRYMVDNADKLLALYSGGATGGTAYTVQYARQKNKEVIIINPNTMERTILPSRLKIL